jgi:hypothetical protein
MRKRNLHSSVTIRRSLRLAGRIAVATCALLALGATRAQAAPIVSIVFTSQNGVPIAPSSAAIAAPGDTLTAEIRVTADAAGISSYGVSVDFDIDLGDELDLISASELLPPGFAFNLSAGVGGTTESTPAVAGAVETFEAATFAAGPVSTTFTAGTLALVVTANVATDGLDLVPFLLFGVDGIFDNAGLDASDAATFVGASVNVPEPGTALSVGASLLAIAIAGRRRGRRD